VNGYQTRNERRVAERAGRRARVDGALAATLPGLNAEAVSAALQQARADRGNALRELDEHLAACPDALTSGDPRCPAVIIRLAQALAAAGHRNASAQASHCPAEAQAD
jgi:hypothetical protein